jgi:hypothetical protein
MSLVKPRIMLATFLKPVQSAFKGLNAAFCRLDCCHFRTVGEMILSSKHLIVANDLLLKMG